MYGRQHRFGFVQPSDSTFAYPVYQVPLAYEPRQEYGYVNDHVVDEPSELEVLEYEEQQLIHQQAQILAKRRQIAAEKRRLQVEAAAEQERIRQWKLQQEAELRRQQWIQQQQQIQRQQQEAIAARYYAQQQQQQQGLFSTNNSRHRQLAAIKEAQLEAALREIESGFEQQQRVKIASQQQQQKRQQQQQQQAEVEVTNPLEFLFQLFGKQQQEQEQPQKQPQQPQQPQQQQRQHPCAHHCASFKPKSSNVASSSAPSFKASPSSQRPSTNATNANKKPNVAAATIVTPTATQALEQIKNRINNVTSRVSDLLHTTFEALTLHHFGKIDSELMQILLALDNLESESEEVKVARKALVTETVSLLEQVDQYKDSYSSASSSDAASDTSSQHNDDGSSVASEHIEEEDLDADSLASDVEPAIAESSQAIVVVQDSSKNDEQVESKLESDQIEQSSPSAPSNDVPSTSYEKNENHLIDFEPSVPAIESQEETQKDEEEQSETISSSAAVEEDPFGFNTIRAASKKEDSSISVPIQIGNNRKSNVVIESSSSQ